MNRRHVLGLLPAAVLPLTRADAGPREIAITAQRFQFTPRVIPLKVGEPVRLLIRSLDFTHGFYLPDLDQRVDLVPGRVVALALTPRAPGTLHFLCDNFCGEGHEGMDGQFDVTA